MTKTRTTILAAVAIVISSATGGWLAQRAEPVGAAATIPAGYVALNPGRIYDSRGPAFTNPRLPGGAQLTINSGQPGASAAGVNIVMTDTVGAGFLTAWPGGGRPGTSVMNSTEAGENIANFLLVPVAADGTFQLYVQNPTHVVVDVMGYMAGGSAIVPSGFNGQITGYGPSSTITSVVGEVANGTGIVRDLRADVRCPNGTVEIDYIFDIPAGAVRGWSVLCDGVFTSGATVTFIEI